MAMRMATPISVWITKTGKRIAAIRGSIASGACVIRHNRT